MNLGPVFTEHFHFVPTGKVTFHGDRDAQTVEGVIQGFQGLAGYEVTGLRKKVKRKWWPWTQDKPLVVGYRFIIGLKSSMLQRYFTLDDVRDLVTQKRLAQTGYEDAIFIEQKGVWPDVKGIPEP